MCGTKEIQVEHLKVKASLLCVCVLGGAGLGEVNSIMFQLDFLKKSETIISKKVQSAPFLLSFC